MVKVNEEYVYSALLKYAGKSKPIKVGDAEVKVCLHPQDIHLRDSPDFILWLEVSLTLFAQDLTVRVPIPIEAEAGGLVQALDDLKKFIERGKYPILLPMLVVATKGFMDTEEVNKLPVKFFIKQIPERLLKY